MSNMTTARWTNTRVSERLGTKYAKEQVMAGLLRVAFKTIPTYVNHILLPAVSQIKDRGDNVVYPDRRFHLKSLNGRAFYS